MPKDGLLLFMFSGHGFARKGKVYLVPQEARSSGDLSSLEEASVAVDMIRQWISEINVRQAIVILDACRNNLSEGKGLKRSFSTNALIKEFDFKAHNENIESTAVFYATGPNQYAYPHAATKLGYFTEAVVDGLRGKAAASGSTVVTLGGLQTYIEKTVPVAVAHDKQGRLQKPYSVVEGYRASDLILAHIPVSEVAQAVVRGQSVEGVDLSDPHALKRTFDFQTLYEENNENPGTLWASA